MSWTCTFKGDLTDPMAWLTTSTRHGCSIYGVVDGSRGRLWLATLTDGAWVKASSFGRPVPGLPDTSRMQLRHRTAG
jgi:hypothetical protein